MGIRSFLAFELSAEMRSTVSGVYENVRNSRLEVRWVKPQGIHITVVFMGDVREEDVAHIGNEVGKVCSEFAPFHASLKGMGCFPNTRNPRVIWIGLEGEIERMSNFREDLQRRLVPFGVKVEKRGFNPHLTLGRFKKPSRGETEIGELIHKHKDLTSPVCALHELVLFKSDLKPGGAIYTKMLSYALSGKR
jgi:RNA 2',3'-cyclic 3'-phosphodiesterase